MPRPSSRKSKPRSARASSVNAGLLRSLKLLDRIPEPKLGELAKFLEPRTLGEGDVVFEEGSAGDSLYFISSGRVRILKKARETGGARTFKELSTLGPGDCFGEMTLFEEAPRSARAQAAGETVLLKLGRSELRTWLKSNPALAVGFFTELALVLSRRLRRSSSELTLLFDLSRCLLEPIASGKELLEKALPNVIPHLEGSWTAGAYIFNEFNDEFDLAAQTEGFMAPEEPASSWQCRAENAWLDGRTYLVVLPGEKRARGFVVFRRATAPEPEEQSEIARTLTTAARLVASGLENIDNRSEAALRSRLSSTREHVPGL